MKQRLDTYMAQQGFVSSRSQAESYIRLGKVQVDGKAVAKPGHFVDDEAVVTLSQTEQYVSRAGLKLASVAQTLHVLFDGKTVLDVGSSTGGFTDYALQHGAVKVYAVDVGTDQLHPELRGDERISLHEKTDIRDFTPPEPVDVVVMDVSFISLREILPHIASIVQPSTQIVAMLKPQFEAGRNQVSKGVIKNDRVRREIIHDFEAWARQRFLILNKADSDVAGARGNRERFYVLHIAKT
jgi:23S rRNA (cytidine1920-2'-O)/16S rRNA (cytidine1409-2'-O)-methyltransferase